MFGSYFMLSHFNQNIKDDLVQNWYIDCTFKIVPKGFYQHIYR